MPKTILTKTTASCNKPAKPTPEVPDWATTTPERREEYDLTMWFNGSSEQDIDLTRDEFIALKTYLVEMRAQTPALKLDADLGELTLLNHRAACLTNVASFLAESDLPGINLLSDLANEMEFHMETGSYTDAVAVGIRLLKRFAQENDADLEPEEEDEEEVDQKQAKWQGQPLMLSEFKETSQRERAFLAKCLKLERNHVNNSSTPLEDFLIDQVLDYADGNRRTPDEMVEEVNDKEGFRGWFEEAVEIGKLMQKDFPQLMNSDHSGDLANMSKATGTGPADKAAQKA